MRKDKKPVIGLAGGIGSGKSYIAGLFAELGCGLIDADAIVAELYRRGRFNGQLVELFGKDALNEDKTVNRGYIASKAFSDSDKLRRLNEIVHPAVIDESRRRIEDFEHDEAVEAIVLDVPLLIESGMDSMCDCLVYIETPLDIRVERLKKRWDNPAEEIKKREIYQISLDIKKKKAKYNIINVPHMQVRQQVRSVFTDIMNDCG